ncbi:MAG: AEC family transporter [Oscillospiraceae bacterium]|nr:AEC family transporter [Oscillospiraceae bacterium]
MAEILIKAGCYIAIILLGIGLRRIGFFEKEDFNVLAKIVIRITLPAAIIVSAAGRQISISLLTITLLGMGGGVIYMVLGYFMNRKGTANQKAFGLLNLSGYNIGNFAMPFTQSFLGPAGVLATGLFDVGNACICLGTAYGIATAVKQGGKLDLRPVGKALIRSVPFLTYVITTLMNLFRIPFPGPVVSLAQIIGNANAFLAMLMIGVGFHLEADKTQLGKVGKMLAVRFSVAAVLAVIYYFILPFDLITRQTLVILAFSPVSTATPGFTADLGEDVGLSSAINSISIICSIVIIVTLLLIML